MKETDFKPVTIDEHEESEVWFNLVYGKPGTGKTFFAGTAGPRTLYINTGAGLTTLKSPYFKSRYSSGPQVIIDIRENIYTGTAKAFDLVADAIDWGLAYRNDDFDTIVLDDATSYRRYARNKAAEISNSERSKPRPNRIQNYQKTELSDYGIEMDMILWFLGTYTELFREKKKHFIMLAHERHVFGKAQKQGEEGPLLAVRPAFTGKASPDDVAAFFDEVWRMEVVGGGENRKYRAITQGDELYMGKTRHAGIFSVREPDPNFLEMLARIKAGKLYEKPTTTTRK